MDGKHTLEPCKECHIYHCPVCGGTVYYDGKNAVLSDTVREWAGLPEEGANPSNPSVTMGETTVSLAELNDGEDGCGRHSFDQIADLIDAQL